MRKNPPRRKSENQKTWKWKQMETEEFEESENKNFQLLQEVEDIKKKKEIYQNTL